MLAPKSSNDQVDCLLRNAELRDQLDPLFDESIEIVDVGQMSTPTENAFLESMLAWERAPMLPVGEWFDPAIRLPEVDQLGDAQVTSLLEQTINQLFDKHIVLDFTDHLTDRELYTLIARDILPSFEKKIERDGAYLHWDCANIGDDPDAWLRYYASPEEREVWSEETGQDAPPSEPITKRRDLPRAPM